MPRHFRSSVSGEHSCLGNSRTASVLLSCLVLAANFWSRGCCLSRGGTCVRGVGCDSVDPIIVVNELIL